MSSQLETTVVGGMISTDAKAPVSAAATLLAPKPFSRESTIDDLVPDMLKEARAALDKSLPEKKPVESSGDLDDDDNAPDDEGDAGNDDEITDIGEDDLDTSPEAIEALLKTGDVKKVVKKAAPKADDGEKPAWQADPEYVAITQKLTAAGIEPEEFEGVIRKVADMSKIESGTYLQNVTRERDTFKSGIEARDAEIRRLREVEKEAHFEQHPETYAKYIDPMNVAYNATAQILRDEGVAIPAMKLLQASSAAEFNTMLSTADLDDDSVIQLKNSWKTYRNTQNAYATAKQEAKVRLAKHLETEIPPKVIDSTLQSSINQLMKREEFSYLRDAIADGINNHPEVHAMVADAHKDFVNLTTAISNPVDHVNSQQFLIDLANYVVSNADAKMHRPKYMAEVTAHAKTKENLKKVLKEYLSLKQAAKGIVGINGTVPVTDRKPDANTVEQKAAALEKFAKGQMKLEDLFDV